MANGNEKMGMKYSVRALTLEEVIPTIEKAVKVGTTLLED